jgi:poly(3-hydroxybutyrate) depolymerase
MIHTGGTPQTGGAPATGGGPATGGRPATGGTPTTGGRAPTGGAPLVTGGSPLGSGGGSSTAGATAAGGAGNAKPSAGCGKTPTLKNSPTSTANQNTLTVSSTSRQFLIRWPTNYDNTHPYRLILDFHGATGKDTDIAPSYFGLFDLSNNSTIFIAPSANGGIWALPTDLTFVDQILTAVEADLCIDTSRIEIEGFSQGAALVWNLACQRSGVFRAAVGHSGGGLAAPSSCQPIPYLGSGGLQESVTQTTQTDQFAKFDGCTVAALPTAPTGGHVCTSYSGCPAADPVRWCNYDGPHTPSPNDSGKTTSWMPSEVWPFFSQF